MHVVREVGGQNNDEGTTMRTVTDEDEGKNSAEGERLPKPPCPNAVTTANFHKKSH